MTTANLSTLQAKTVTQAEALGLDLRVIDEAGTVIVQVVSRGASELWITSSDLNTGRRTNTVTQYTWGQQLPLKASDITAELERFARIP